jgi:hypothetical protein
VIGTSKARPCSTTSPTAAQAAETMGTAKAKFTDHYELPREFAANGGLMTHDGRWVTGEGA